MFLIQLKVLKCTLWGLDLYTVLFWHYLGKICAYAHLCVLYAQYLSLSVSYVLYLNLYITGQNDILCPFVQIIMAMVIFSCL